jgi:hypothetical protein
MQLLFVESFRFLISCGVFSYGVLASLPLRAFRTEVQGEVLGEF